ncbi:RNA 2',3'-cyclic phosphodiesterase [Virgibacillus sp. 179-BFC.A HS]|uniref:RNA 2',3'-cyclic phosphodiesterase n=1 Tax=Tigheibacillus jepli TaxID=3035914 RepID=A0ABU5CH56_9BACI|nr:RNA 2',3'-cyclic phosphodiesterase [Virgibacillus sp. 179-BFC.A HS]MDY0405296.1 RNA 2',3'-cyclic phosphodiesterase [Virgibacillus sp. 179-BFC.A HS]
MNLQAPHAHYFLAVPLPDFVKAELSRWQQTAQTQLAYKQWTHPQDFHITVKFLGGVANEKLNHLQDVLHEVEARQPFEVQVKGLHTFGNPAQPRVLWAGVEKSKEILTLNTDIEKIGAAAGFSPENRSYQPHITIGKKWEGPKSASLVQKWLSAYEDKTLHFLAEQLVIYKIYPGQAPKYKVHAAFPFRGGK